MAIAWRLADPAFASDLEGTGNRTSGARWNSPGRGVLYCSENLSLCVLETLVHLNPAARAVLPPRVALKISYPDEIERFGFHAVSGAVNLSASRRIGDNWLDLGEQLVLAAPSIIVPQERNIMFNPAHPAMAEVSIVEMIEFNYDTRLAGA